MYQPVTVIKLYSQIISFMPLGHYAYISNEQANFCNTIPVLRKNVPKQTGSQCFRTYRILPEIDNLQYTVWYNSDGNTNFSKPR